MKKIILFLVGTIIGLSISAQPPLRRPDIEHPRPLPNQFRDFVDHQQRWENKERPIIERKDGKVIITMTEQQFRRMQMVRRAQMIRMTNLKQSEVCSKCQVRHHRGPIHNKF